MDPSRYGCLRQLVMLIIKQNTSALAEDSADRPGPNGDQAEDEGMVPSAGGTCGAVVAGALLIRSANVGQSSLEVRSCEGGGWRRTHRRVGKSAG